MTQNLADLFTPTLNKSYCSLFYFLSIVQFLFLVLAVIALVFSLGDFRKIKYVIINHLMSIVTLLFLYVYNRVLYSMCNKSM